MNSLSLSVLLLRETRVVSNFYHKHDSSKRPCTCLLARVSLGYISRDGTTSTFPIYRLNLHRDCKVAVPFHSPIGGVRASHCPLSFHHGIVHVFTFLTVWLVSNQLFKTETYAITPRCVEKVEGMRNLSFTLFALVLSQESGSMTLNDSVCFISTLYIFMLRNLMNISFKSFLKDTLSRIKVYDKRWYENNPVFKTL